MQHFGKFKSERAENLHSSREQQKGGDVPVVDLNICIELRIVLKSHELKVQNGWKRDKFDAFFGLLHPVFARIVLVLAFENLRLNVVAKRLENCKKKSVKQRNGDKQQTDCFVFLLRLIAHRRNIRRASSRS